MQIKNYPFKKLPFSDLYKTYLDNFSTLGDFYETNPFDFQAVKAKADQVLCSFDRSSIVELLTDFNQRFDTTDAAFANIKRFEDKQSLAIVTGQQLGVYGGPAYTAYKTLTAVHLAQAWEKKLNRPVIPVFWLADEDHDYEEVNSITLLDGNKMRTAALPGLHNYRPPVSELVLPEDLAHIRKEAREAMPGTDFTDKLWEMLDACFHPGVRFDQAFGNFIAKLFSGHGLVLAGSNTRPVKKLAGSWLKTAIESADEIRDALERQSAKIKIQFRQQATLYDSNLFYLDEPGRVKIIRNGTHWKTDTGQHWQTQELLEEIDQYPERFSPNVFLRPVLQDKLLPTLGYVAGPGEIAYYGQMKTMYRFFDSSMPVIFPRMSATVIEPAIDRIAQELPFEIHEYDKRIEDLETEFVDRTEQLDIEAVFSEWKHKIEELAAPETEKIMAIDPTLKGAAGKATTVYLKELDKLENKVYRAVKKQEQIQLNRIRRIKSQLFPGGLQERNIATIYYMNKYGTDIWDRILQQLDDDESFREHKLIYI